MAELTVDEWWSGLVKEASEKGCTEAYLAYQQLEERGREVERLKAQQTCIDIWLRRREPVTHESATLRSVQEFIERAEGRLAEMTKRNEANVHAYSQELTERTTQLQQAEAREAKLRGILDDALTVMEASAIYRERLLAEKMRAALAVSPEPAPPQEKP